jgi:hypothetical protein
MNIIGNDNWVVIPDSEGKFGNPIFLSKGSTLTSNFDEIKVLKNLDVDHLDFSTEKEVYTELVKPTNINLLKNEVVEKLEEKAEELGVTITKTALNKLTALKSAIVKPGIL